MGGNNKMELFFFRHAQGQHVMKPPKSLQLIDPHPSLVEEDTNELIS